MAKTNEELNTAFLAAVRGEDLAETRKLLAKGADVNCQDWREKTALESASGNESVEMVKLLLEKGAKIRTGLDMPPLYTAAIKGRVEIGKLLVAHGAKPDELAGGQTALFMAVQFKQPAYVEFLLGAGASATIRDKDGKTALDYLGKDAGEPARKIRKLLEAKGAGNAPPAEVKTCSLSAKAIEKALGRKLPKEYLQFITNRTYDDENGKTFKLPTYRGGAQVWFSRASADGKPEVLTLLDEADDLEDADALVPIASIYVGKGTGTRESQFLVVRTGKGATSPVLMFEHEKNGLVPVADSIDDLLAKAK